MTSMGGGGKGGEGEKVFLKLSNSTQRPSLGMKEGGFNLKKWISNSEKLMQWIDQDEGVPIMDASMVSEEDKTYTQTQLALE